MCCIGVRRGLNKEGGGGDKIGGTGGPVWIIKSVLSVPGDVDRCG